MHPKQNIQQHKMTPPLQKKTKARFGRLLQLPAWKWRGHILVSALNKFVTYVFTH